MSLLFASLPPLTDADLAALASIRAAAWDFWFNRCLTLESKDRENIRRVHALTDAQIDALRWRSVPGPIALLVLEWEIEKDFGAVLMSLPGWFPDNGNRGRFNAPPGRGLLLPWHNRDGRIEHCRWLAHPAAHPVKLRSPFRGGAVMRHEARLRKWL